MTEANLRKYLSEETLRLNLEHHYWLKDTFLSKIGRMAENLEVLSLRRLKISNESLVEIMTFLKKLQKLDVSCCPFIKPESIKKFIENNGETFT